MQGRKRTKEYAMLRIHGLVGIVTVAQGDVYAECFCGIKSFGDDEDEAFESYRMHKRLIWAAES
jgi:hypothetical protein